MGTASDHRRRQPHFVCTAGCPTRRVAGTGSDKGADLGGLAVRCARHGTIQLKRASLVGVSGARRIAVNVARLPELLGKRDDA